MRSAGWSREAMVRGFLQTLLTRAVDAFTQRAHEPYSDTNAQYTIWLVTLKCCCKTWALKYASCLESSKVVARACKLKLDAHSSRYLFCKESGLINDERKLWHSHDCLIAFPLFICYLIHLNYLGGNKDIDEGDSNICVNLKEHDGLLIF